MHGARSIAYFSMEIAVDPRMPTYAGGLGVLAGDTLRSAADEAVPMLAVTLLHRKGYLTQEFDESGWQHARPTDWPVEQFLVEMAPRATVEIESRIVTLRAWKYEITGISGARVPVFFLDADVPENSAWDRTLTHFLYGGDSYYRICQEIILGIGGVRMLRALGFDALQRFHMNEGHSSLLTLELLVEEARRGDRTQITKADIDAVRPRCIFTTHTPVASGHDQFPMDLIGRMLRSQHGFFSKPGAISAEVLGELLPNPPGSADPAEVFRADRELNLTHLALSLSHYVNGVAKRHAEVSQRMFAKYHIDEITNGVHAATWVAPALREVYDRHMPGWEADNFSLRYAINLPPQELWAAHQVAKQSLLARIRDSGGPELAPDTLTLGFARRFTAYKRADLLLADPGRLRAIAGAHGRLQVIFGGKAHPNDTGGKEIIQRIRRIGETLGPEVRIVYLPNYDLQLASLIVAGVDVWVNTPLPPLEASGTSGMKAALNGVPSLSILDGWWLEGCIEGVTGWSVGERPAAEHDPARNARDIAALYVRLEEVVMPSFYGDRDGFIRIMRQAIALNGSFFNTQRMIQQYVTKAYL